VWYARVQADAEQRLFSRREHSEYLWISARKRHHGETGSIQTPRFFVNDSNRERDRDRDREKEKEKEKQEQKSYVDAPDDTLLFKGYFSVIENWVVI
jgi:hypothetical protein